MTRAWPPGAPAVLCFDEVRYHPGLMAALRILADRLAMACARHQLAAYDMEEQHIEAIAREEWRPLVSGQIKQLLRVEV